MTAKEYLTQIKGYEVRIKQKKKELQDLKEEIYSIPTSGQAYERVKSSRGKDIFDKVDACIDLENKINSEIADFMHLKDKIIDEIQQLQDADCVNFLFKRFVENKIIEVIADEMCCCIRNVNRIQSRALKEFTEILERGDTNGRNKSA